MGKPAGINTALLSLLLLGAGACAKKEQIVIFATGRAQGRLWQEAAQGSARNTGGPAVFKSLYDGEKLPKLAVDTGNWFSATREGRLTRGKSTLACLNAVPYSAAAVGLEDLSLTPAELQKLSESSALPLLASNVYLRTNTKPPFLHSSRIVEAGGHKVGFFSLVISSPTAPNRRTYLPKYKLEKETYDAQRAIKALKSEGAELIVMLLSVNPGEEASQDFFRGLLAKLPRIDLVITDEPAVKKPFKAHRAWIAGAGLEMSSAARLVLTLDQAGKMTDLDWKEIELNPEKYGEDQEILKLLEGYRKSSASHFSRRVGFLNTALPLTENDTTPAADFAADCIRRWARTNAAIISRKEAAAGFSSGTVTLGELHSAFPLGSSIVFVKIRGDALERALTGLQASEISVSGLRLFVRDGALDRAETETGPLRQEHIYRLAVPDSLVTGRENPLLSSAMEFANSRRSLRDVVGWCFARQKSFSRPAGGRIMQSGDK